MCDNFDVYMGVICDTVCFLCDVSCINCLAFVCIGDVVCNRRRK